MVSALASVREAPELPPLQVLVRPYSLKVSAESQDRIETLPNSCYPLGAWINALLTRSFRTPSTRSRPIANSRDPLYLFTIIRDVFELALDVTGRLVEKMG